LEAIDTFEDGIEEEELVPRNKLGNDELEIIKRSIMQGLGLQRIPDPSKVRFINNYSMRREEREKKRYIYYAYN